MLERENKTQRILVFRIGQLGDTIVALPAFWMLRAAYPTASISLLTNSPANRVGAVAADDVLPPTGMFDQVIKYPTGHGNFAALLSRMGLANALRRCRFDRAYYLMPRNRSLRQIARDRTFFRLAGIKNVVGTEFLEQNLLKYPIPVPTPTVRSETEFLIGMLRSVGVEAEDLPRDLLGLSEYERGVAAKWLEKNCRLDDTHSLVAIAPGSNWPSKIWPMERFEAVVSRLISKFNIFPIVVGGAQDRRAGDRLIETWKRGANAAGQLTVRHSGALLEHCSLFLGNDTGTMHLAAAVGTPCVAVFAATDWIGKWAPFGGTRNRVLRARVDCEGCRLQDCPYGNKCLKLVSVEEAFGACSDILSRVTGSSVSSAIQI